MLVMPRYFTRHAGCRSLSNNIHNGQQVNRPGAFTCCSRTGFEVSGFTFDSPGTRRSSAPRRRLVGPGDILPTGTSSGAPFDTPPAWLGSPLGSRGSEPVPPRLPHFAIPRSVPHLATVVAGAYPLRLPPDVWSPGLLALPGPCYWLIASGTPIGWRGGCLFARLVYFASFLASVAVRDAGCPARVSRPFACRYAVPCGLYIPRTRLCCPSGPRRVSVSRVCDRALLAYTPSPAPGSVWRVHYVRFSCRALVGPFQAVFASLRFLPRSRAPHI